VQIGTSSWTSISGSSRNSLAVRNDGLLFAWGYNVNGQTGDGFAGFGVNRSSPVQIGTSSWTSVAAGGSHSLAVKNDGLLFAWGVSTFGQLGNNDSAILPNPVGVSSWTSVEAGSDHSLAIRNDGLLFAWGLGSYGRLGDSTFTTKSSPVQIGSSSWTSVAAGGSHSLAVKNDGLLFAWGYNNNGQLGNNDSLVYPKKVGDSFVAIGAGSGFGTVILSS
jgi:alpha-tubulin suppressor-like RCC1 family protein